MLNHKQSSTPEFGSPHADCVDQLDWLQPELGVAITSFDVDMGRLRPFVAEEEETVALGQEHVGTAHSVSRLVPSRAPAVTASTPRHAHPSATVPAAFDPVLPLLYPDGPIHMGALKGFPNPPAMVRGRQSWPAPHAS